LYIFCSALISFDGWLFVDRSFSRWFLQWHVERTSVVRQPALEVPQEVMVEVILPVAYQRRKRQGQEISHQEAQDQ